MRNTLLITALLFGLTTTAQEAQWTSIQDINPFIGTGGHGHTHPSAQAPFGMIQLGPNTRYDGWDGCGGYHYTDSAMYGFTCTHLSGTGVSDYGDLLMLPYSSPTKEGDHIKFFKEDEHAQAGYYACILNDGTRIEATAGDRIGKLRLHFPRNSSPGIMVDLNFRDRVLKQDFSALGNGKFEGHRISEGWAREQHFYFGFNISPIPDSVWQLTPGVYWLALPEGTFDAEVSIGMSGTSEEGAWKNYHGERAERDFEKVFAETQGKWAKELAKSTVKSASADDRAILATALYHAYAVPNLWSDVDGAYRGADGKIYTDTEHAHYTVYSLWDTYRTAHPLYTITQPERTQEFIYGMLDMYKQRGRLPIWELAGNETDCMIGYHSVSVLADAIAKGYHTDTVLTLEAMRATAEMNVFGLGAYQESGFLSIEDESESVSKTLEYAYDDACIAWTAERLGNLGMMNSYNQRASAYRSLIDPESGFVRPRTNGDFLSPYAPQEVNNHFTEANAYQYSFSPVHDIEGWMEVLTNFRAARENWNSLPRKKQTMVVKSRHDVLEDLLDELFTAPSETTGREQADITGLIGQYAHGNEPSHHIAYLYNATNNPGKTSYWVNEVLNSQYQNTPDGLSGNEDCGQMSAWYVMASMGLYPLVPGQPHYQLSTPKWDAIHLELANGKSLDIAAKGTGPYLSSYNLGEEVMMHKQKRYVSHQKLLEGGTWDVERGTDEGLWNATERYKTSLNNPTPPAPIIRVNRTFSGETPVEIIPTGSYDLWRYDRYENVKWKKDRKGRERIGTAYDNGFVTAIPPHYGYGYHIAKAVFTQRDDNYSARWIQGTPTSQYTAGGAGAAVDGIRGDTDWRKGHWIGIQGEDAVLEISLEKPKAMRSISVGILKDIRAWIALPKALEISIWYEGSTAWKTIDVLPVENPLGEEEATRKEVIFAHDSQRTVKRVRVKFTNAGKLQDWHPGAGYPSYFFVDEVWLD
ncbi:MAG: GH92 family glycosyl hydrolase [Flavobacteriales bacterium]